MEAFNDEFLKAHTDSFYGYGTYAGAYWFVGMEEGGGDSFKEVESKLSIWGQHGRKELEDSAEFHLEAGIRQWFRPIAKTQPTWGRYIRILLGAQGVEPSKESIRAYQTDRLDRKNGETCLLELLPLPSPSVGHWHYAQRSKLQRLASRERYRAHYALRRADHIQSRIIEQRPAAVVFTSVDPLYRKWWERIAGVVFEQVMYAGKACYIGHRDGTKFVVVQHPVAFGLTNEYWKCVGEFIREH